MRFSIVTPAPPRSRKGNRVTALRWSRILRSLNHRVDIMPCYNDHTYDCLIALHARRSHASVKRFNAVHPASPIIVALTGTDLYHDLHRSKTAHASLEIADRLIVLQPKAIESIPHKHRPKTRVIIQSMPAPKTQTPKRKNVFEVAVIGHLRPVKDPFRTALASRLLPTDSRIAVTHVGQALSDAMKKRAEAECAKNPRYHWLGELPRARAQRILARSRLLVITSKLEGGANVLSEAIAAKVPVLSSAIDGSVGILGEDYPGYFPIGDTQALTALLYRAESDPRFYNSISRHCARLAPKIHPNSEKRAWSNLIKELPHSE